MASAMWQLKIEEWKIEIKPETKGNEDEDIGKVIIRKEFGKLRSVRENMEKEK